MHIDLDAAGRVLSAPPPGFTRARAETIARDTFGVEGPATQLGSERDQNFRIDAIGGERFVLKIANAAEDPAVVDLQDAAVRHAQLADPGLPLGDLVPSLEGPFVAATPDDAGIPHLVRLITYVEGREIDDDEPVPDEALRSLARVTARMGHALRGLFHPAAGRPLLWDLKRAPGLRPLLVHLEDPDRRALVRGVLDRFEPLMPEVERLRAQVVHNDLSLSNVLFDERHEVSGVLDLGDVAHTALMCDLVAAMTSVLRGRPDPFDKAAAFVDSYQAVAPLEDEELRLLFPLVTARLATTVLVSAWRVKSYPENAEYITGWDPGSWELLEAFEGMGFDHAERRFAQACGVRLPVPDGELLARRRRAMGGDMSPLTYSEPLHLVRGEGAHMFDARGTPYLDAYNNVPVVGHQHPHVVQAIARQNRTLNTNTRYLHEAVVELSERLTASMPDGLDTCIFVNSGSEANDVAWRLATQVTGRSGGIVSTFAYHGVTAAVDALTPEHWLPGERPHHVETIGPPDPYRGGDPLERATDVETAARALAARGVEPALVLIDSGFTSDGIFPLPPGYLIDVVRHTHEAGALFVADEVQTGFGRTGSMWGFEAPGVVPDIVTLGKPMGNGFPVAAVVTRADIVERFASDRHLFSTFGGNPVAAAAALAVLDVVEREELPGRATAVGDHLRAALAALADRHVAIGDVRGRGLLIGVDLVLDRETREPATALASEVADGMRHRRVLVGTTGPSDNVIKIRPPLVVSPDEADHVVAALNETLAATARS